MLHCFEVRPGKDAWTGRNVSGDLGTVRRRARPFTSVEAPDGCDKVEKASSSVERSVGTAAEIRRPSCNLRQPTARMQFITVQLHQTGAQATVASTRSAFVTELSLSHAFIAPANPWATNWAMTRCLVSG